LTRPLVLAVGGFGDLMAFALRSLGIGAVLAVAGCIPVPVPKPADVAAVVAMAPAPQPAMRWDHRPEAAAWTEASLAAIARKDAVLANKVPADIASWCPAYPEKSIAERRAFWAGLLSAVAKYESTWNPAAVGGKGKWIGLMQIAPKSAQNYGCSATSSKALKDGAANLSCAVEILAHQVARDEVVAGKGNRGIGRDWMPLRKSAKRAEMAAWTSAQSYCRG
jgi:soluble lytic murein transglycosylase-like protein